MDNKVEEERIENELFSQDNEDHGLDCIVVGNDNGGGAMGRPPNNERICCFRGIDIRDHFKQEFLNHNMSRPSSIE